MASARHRSSTTVAIVAALAASVLAIPSSPTSAVPVEPTVLDDAPNLLGHEYFTTLDDNVIYVEGDNDISLFDASARTTAVIASGQAPNDTRLPRLIGQAPERLLYETADGKVKARTLVDGTVTDFFTIPAGARIAQFSEGFGDDVAAIMTVDLGNDMEATYSFPVNAPTVPAPLATYVNEGFADFPRLLQNDTGILIERREGGVEILSLVTSAGIRDLATGIELSGVAGGVVAGGIEQPQKIWYSTPAASGNGAIDLWVRDTSTTSAVKVLTHPTNDFPRFNAAVNAAILDDTVYSLDAAFATWTVVPLAPPAGASTSTFYTFNEGSPPTITAFFRFVTANPFSSVSAGSAVYPIAGTEPIRTAPPTSPPPTDFGPDVYAVVTDYGFGESVFAGNAFALLINEPGGTFGIRYRPPGGTAADERVLDTGATVKYDQFDVDFDDRGSRLAFIKNDSSLNFVDVRTAASVEVALRGNDADFVRMGGGDSFSGKPGDIVVIDDGCSVSTCIVGSRLMYVEIPSLYIDPRLWPLVPARVLETRVGPTFLTVDGLEQGKGRVAAGQILELPMTDRTNVGVPGTASAVVLNLVAVAPSGVGFLTVFPCGSPRPLAASVNYRSGEVSPNAVLAKLGEGGKVCIYSEAATDIVADVNGYVPTGGDVFAVDPARVYESRTATGLVTTDGAQQGVGRVPAGGVAMVNVAGRGGVPDDFFEIDDFRIRGSVFLNVVAVRPDATGFLTVYPCSSKRPLAANVNFTAGGAASNAVFADIGSAGDVCVYSSVATDIVVDVNGFTPSLASTGAITPLRFLETRSGPGFETFDGEAQGIGRVGAESVTKLKITDRLLSRANSQAVFLNVVAVAPKTTGFLTVYPCDSPRPLAANVNFSAGKVGYNAVLAKVGSSGEVCIYSNAETDLVVDLNGVA